LVRILSTKFPQKKEDIQASFTEKYFVHPQLEQAFLAGEGLLAPNNAVVLRVQLLRITCETNTFQALKYFKA
jgi:hypothetical protein